jgi:integrase/recombinase XerD
MLTTLFPKYHQRYRDCPVANWLAGFAEWLVSTGYAHDPAHDHVRRLKQVLETHGSVTPDAVFSMDELATMFRSARQQAVFRGTQHAFERFLAARGHLIVEPDCNRFAPLLGAYRRHLFEVRGLATSTISQHLASATAFLTHAVPGDGLLQTSLYEQSSSSSSPPGSDSSVRASSTRSHNCAPFFGSAMIAANCPSASI